MPGCNEANCTCPWVTCVRHGKCCECVNHHRKVAHVPNCLSYMVDEAVKKAVDETRLQPECYAPAEAKP